MFLAKAATLTVIAVLTAGAMGEQIMMQASTSNAADRQEILDHIDSIFAAYIRKDRETIRKTHTTDWTGFQGPSTKIERGIEDYMANAEASLQGFDGTSYEILDTEVQLYGDVAVVYYVATYSYEDANGESGTLRLRSVDIYRKQAGHWIQCGSHITPIPEGGTWGEGDGGGEAPHR